MLSILIPIYNFDVRTFVMQLSQQAEALPHPVEIICLDDGSEAHFKAINQDISDYACTQYHLSSVNLGRSGIRNRLAQMAQYQHLIFLDCDGECVSDDYLKNYITLLANYDVIYGGRVYAEERPVDRDLNFHWYVGTAKEEIIAEDRNLAPYKSFMTNNFMIRKEVYDQIKMDESIKGYGHEDTFFAIELRKMGFEIRHIQNPIKHIGLETTEEFLRKSENGVKNLAFILTNKGAGKRIRLASVYFKAKRLGLILPIVWLVKAFEPAIKRNFHSPNPNLLWFDLWKLSLLQKYLTSE